MVLEKTIQICSNPLLGIIRGERNWKVWNVLQIILVLFLVYPARATGDLIHESDVEEQTPQPDYARSCGLNLLFKAGKNGKESHSLPDLYRTHSVSDDEEFMEYLFSIIYVESRFNRKAVSHADAHGLMQLTKPAVKEAIQSCNLRPLSNMAKLHDSVTNIRYGSCYLKKLLEEMNGDWTRTLIVYNGGYVQLERYNQGLAIASETANYVLQVNRTLEVICRAGRGTY